MIIQNKLCNIVKIDDLFFIDTLLTGGLSFFSDSFYSDTPWYCSIAWHYTLLLLYLHPKFNHYVPIAYTGSPH